MPGRWEAKRLNGFYFIKEYWDTDKHRLTRIKEKRSKGTMLGSQEVGKPSGCGQGKL